MNEKMPDDGIYLNHLSRASQTEDIRAHEDIRNASGLKLLSRGERVDADVIDRIVRHKLLTPIDFSIRIAGAVTSSRLVQDARGLLDEVSPMGEVLRQILKGPQLPAYIGRLHLEPMIINKLTIMQKNLPDLYTHSLQASCLMIALGSLCNANNHELDALAGIGLLHDIGNLHLDVALLEPERHFDPVQWRRMRAHPVIAYLILKHWPQHYTDIARPVLEHHERIDGSGYPRKLMASQTSWLGRIAAMAEMVTGVLQKHPSDHLAVVLKGQHGKLDKEIVDTLLQALRKPAPSARPAVPESPREALVHLCGVASTLLEDWQLVATELKRGEHGNHEALAARMDDVTNLLRQTGYSADYLSWLSAIETDLVSMNEALSVLREVFYGIRQSLPELTQLKNERTQTPLFPAQLERIIYSLTLAEKDFCGHGEAG